MSPQALWLGLLCAGALIDYFIPLPFVPLRFPPIATGLVFVMIGFAIVGLALHEMRDFNAPDEETGIPVRTLVTGGVYSFSRNPIYLGLHVALLGSAISFDSLWVLVGLIPFFWFLNTRIVPQEEAELMRTYGDLYQEYCKDVRRWL